MDTAFLTQEIVISHKIVTVVVYMNYEDNAVV